MRNVLKHILLLGLVVPAAFGCKQITEEALYDENDDDWTLVQAVVTEKCKSEGAIWAEFEKRAEFDRYFTENQYYYKLTVQNPDGTEDIDYLRIDNIAKDSMSIRYYDSDRHPEGSAVFTYRSIDQLNLSQAIANGVCDTREDYAYSSSNYESKTALSFTDKRQNGDDREYVKISDAFTAKASYPLLFTVWNKTRSTTEKEAGEDPKAVKTQKWTMEAVSEKTCEENDVCDGIVWSAIVNPGVIDIDKGAFNNNALSSEFLKVSF